jgi:hypothetical protein
MSVAGAGAFNGDGLVGLAIAPGIADKSYPTLSDAVDLVFGPQRTAEPRFRRGAVRGEAALDISDGIRLLGYLFLGTATPACLDAADGDDSGVIELTDAIYILGFLFLGGPAPLPPYPECGVDGPLVPDELGCLATSPSCR